MRLIEELSFLVEKSGRSDGKEALSDRILYTLKKAGNVVYKYRRIIIGVLLTAGLITINIMRKMDRVGDGYNPGSTKGRDSAQDNIADKELSKALLIIGHPDWAISYKDESFFRSGVFKQRVELAEGKLRKYVKQKMQHFGLTFDEKRFKMFLKKIDFEAICKATAKSAKEAKDGG